MDLLGGDVLNFCLGVDAVGHDPGLRAGKRNRLHPQGVQSNSRERDCRLLAGSKEDVHLPFAGQGHDFFGKPNQIISYPAHSRHDYHNLLALGMILGHSSRHIFDALRIAH